jgi:hypothetical protein
MMAPTSAPSSRRRRAPPNPERVNSRSLAAQSLQDGAPAAAHARLGHRRSDLAAQAPVPRRVDGGLALRRGMPFDDWAAIGCRLARLSSACAWSLGDWLVFGAEAYGERYKEAVSTTRLDYQTLRNYAWVAGRFSSSRRRDNLSFQHHAEVASLPEPQQELWLQRAEAMRWSRNELRRRVTASRRPSRPRSDETCALSVPVTSMRQERWRAAAEAAGQDLVGWATRVLDAAADLAVNRPRSD